jgi:DNA-binding FadR family transcriptional regulator
MGVISQRVGDGTYLSAGSSKILSEPMGFLILVDGISLHELVEARFIIEPELATLAAERATTDDLKKLSRAIECHERSRHDLKASIEAGLSFHEVIFEAAGNRACSRILSLIHRSVWKALSVTSQFVESQRPIASHKAIYSAIHPRDPNEARLLMVRHMRCAQNLLSKAATGALGLKLNGIRPLRLTGDVKHRRPRHLFHSERINNGRKSSARSRIKG